MHETPDNSRYESPRRLKVTVLRGGPGPERAVSLVSGEAVAGALRRRGHDVYEADIAPDDLRALDQAADVVFPALHGTFGEDGTLQRILEQRRICFVGSGSHASALAMDKAAAKEAVAGIGVATPAYRVIRNTASSRGALSTQHSALGTEVPLPVVVKPVDQGSSVATFVVREPERLAGAVCEVVGQFGRALVEQFVEGDEITVGILGGQALPPICVRPRRPFYDYQAKYEDDATEYLFNAGHPPALLECARAQSERVFAQLGCRHLGRVDWMADRAGQLWFLEVNTIPGFTSHSLVPKAAAHVGIPFDELVERLVWMAVLENL